jgi:hypothetical protein
MTPARRGQDAVKRLARERWLSRSGSNGYRGETTAPQGKSGRRDKGDGSMGHKNGRDDAMDEAIDHP